MNNQDALNLFKEVLKINSVLGNEKEVADLLESHLKDAGIQTQQIEYSPGRNQLVATLGSGSPVLGFTGHMDVVSTGEIKWEEDPFAAVEKDGKIYGRGAADMKSGLVALTVAAIRLKEAGLPAKGTLKLLFTVGEETSGIGAEQLVNEGFGDDLDALIVGEPTSLEIDNAHKGALWPSITTYGKTAHGSMPQEGYNAIESMLKVLAEVKETFDFESAHNKTLGNSTSSLNIMKGGNGTNVVPDKCNVQIDIRTVPEQDHEEIKAKFAGIMDKLAKEDENFKAEIEYINDLPSVFTDLEDPFVKLIERACEKIVGRSKVGKFSAYTDASQFVKAKKSYPIIIIGPGPLSMAHQPNEHVEVEEFYKAISLYEEIAKDFLA